MLALGAALASVACARRYPVSGMVLRVDQEHRTIVVSHGAIAGYMPAMAMLFHVRDGQELAGLKPGMHVEFQLVVGRNESYADKLRLEGGARYEVDSAAPAPARSVAVALGERVPDFGLTDQERRPVKLSDFAGKVVAVTFIYTRCPLPDYCPRMTDNFQKMQERFRNRIGRDLFLLTVTFDPQYDKPAVLAEYGRGFHADADGWRFLTGPMPEIRRVCGLFGVEFWPDEGQITHSLRTAVIDREGRLAANLAGNNFTAQQLGDLVEAVIGGRQ